MVLRAGIILPFQYGDVKKLLMVGSPEEDRDLKLFDFTNVVRAAFNIYNFEFRNKQIDFQIPEELLVNYLEQCRDLTNFVIQIDQVSGDRRLPPHCATCNCSISRYLGIKSQPILSSSSGVNNNYGLIVADKYHHQHHNSSSNNNNNNNNSSNSSSNHNKLSSFINNEQLLHHHQQQQHHRLSVDAPTVAGNAVCMPSSFGGVVSAIKGRNFSSTPSDLDEDSDAPTPPKLRISNSLNDSTTMPSASAAAAAAAVMATLNNEHTNDNDEHNDDDDVDEKNNINNNNSNNTRTSPTSPMPLTIAAANKSPYEQQQQQQQHNSNVPPMPLSHGHGHGHCNDVDVDDEDSHLSAKSALKAAFVLQQKEFLLQQQLQHQQQQLNNHHSHSHHHQQQQHLHHQPPHHLYDDEHSFDQYQRTLQYPEVGFGGLHETENNGSRQRKERMSKRQKELYVEFLEQNQIVNSHRRNDPVLDGFWLRLANILNDCPNGAAKSVSEWKQAFDNWRYRVFLYARHNSQLNGEDAQLNSKAFKPLTLTDKRAYNLWIRNPDTAPANIEKLPTDLNCSED